MPLEVIQQWEKQNEQERKFGHVRNLIHADWRGKKWVAVGNEVFAGNWTFFPDFLRYYIKSVMTDEWGRKELNLPLESRHPIMQWYDGMCRLFQNQQSSNDGVIRFLPDGCTQAYLLLAYDLYSLHHSRALQLEVVERLKRKAGFQGARYELFVAATCIRAGFSIEYENERDRSTKHAEFRATHHISGDVITVEAKSRHRRGVLGQEGVVEDSDRVRTRIGNLLNKGIAKKTNLPHVVFIDLNLPPSQGNPLQKSWFKDVAESIEKSGGKNATSSDPFNLVVFTNHPFHYVKPGEITPSPEVLSVMGRNPCVPVKDIEVLGGIHDAAMKFGAIPQRFEEAD